MPRCSWTTRPWTQESVKSLTQIISGVERTAKLIRQMLAFSRKQVMQREVLDLNVVATNVTDMLGPLLGESIVVRRNLARETLSTSWPTRR